MTRKLTLLTVLTVGLIGLTATTPTAAQGPAGGGQKQDGKRTLLFIYMSPQAINVEGWYPGSGHTGGGLMKCMARYAFEDGTTYDINVSKDAAWSIDDEDVYWIEEGVTLFDDGLWVNPYFIDVVAGFTYVRATFEDKETAGEIYVEDYRDP
jgi:hypothetical protein